MMNKIILTFYLFSLVNMYSQEKALPILDMHLHAMDINSFGPPPTAMCTPLLEYPTHDPKDTYSKVWSEWLRNPDCENPIWSPKTDDELMRQTFEVLERNNIYAVTSGVPHIVSKWKNALPHRIISGLWFSKYLGSEPSVEEVEKSFKEGKLEVFSEIAIQYDGKSPSDDSFEPYLDMAEENDIPVGIHIGTGPPGAIYIGGSPNYRAKLHSALILEEALVKHPNLRVYIMHAGWPMLDDLLAVLYSHPQVYIDIGIIDWQLPRKEFHRYLQRIVEAGFGKRVMFGSDQMAWPKTIEVAIESIETAKFLSEEQKRDVFYNNAARFLRFSKEKIDQHHGK